MNSSRSIRFGVSLAALTGLALAQPVPIQVDAARHTGPLRPVWSFFGYDEPNYTYMKDGRKLLSELAALSPVPVYVRAHNLLITGDGTAALKWGSTNAYTEDATGKPVYDWTIVDRIFDTYIERNMKPLVEIGFMPEALSVASRAIPPSLEARRQLRRHLHRLGVSAQGLRQVGANWSISGCSTASQKYGRAEVESWYWEVWNEPNIGYWQGTPEEYHKLYDYTADAVKRALPAARVGGPDSTGPGERQRGAFLRDFLEHVRSRQELRHRQDRFAARLHRASTPKAAPGSSTATCEMGIENQLQDIARGFEIVASFPELKDKPDHHRRIRPGGLRRLLRRASIRRTPTATARCTRATPRRSCRGTCDLAAKHGVNLVGAVTWAFEFEDQPYFDGFRDLATNGIDKPVLNVFRMFGMMTGDRVAVTDPAAASLDAMLAGGVKDQPDVHAMASLDTHSAAVLISNYHDNSKPGPAAPIDLSITGLPPGRMLVQHFRVDDEHSNSFEAWKRMGSPQQPTADQYSLLEAAGQLASVDSPRWETSTDGRLRLNFDLPRHGVSLILVTW